jgi:hypothetical protein
MNGDPVVIKDVAKAEIVEKSDKKKEDNARDDNNPKREGRQSEE